MGNEKNNLIARRYSDALIELVKEKNLDMHSINSQIRLIVESIHESEELQNIISNPVLSTDNKKDVIVSLLNGKVDDIIIDFIKLLIDKDRFMYFSLISDCFSAAVDSINNIQKIKVISAVELSDEIKIKLISKLSAKLNKRIELITGVNPEIIAGLIIKIDDNIIDMSLKHKIEQLKKEMTK